MLGGQEASLPGPPTAACILPGRLARLVHPYMLLWNSTGMDAQGSLKQASEFPFRGICHKGKDCEYLHQLPTEYHEQLLTSDHTVDIFGRDKLPGSHTGTKGVGTYDRESKTLYVHYGGAGHLGAPVIRQLVQVRLALFSPSTNTSSG